jgi:hypothetical protein
MLQAHDLKTENESFLLTQWAFRQSYMAESAMVADSIISYLPAYGP